MKVRGVFVALLLVVSQFAHAQEEFRVLYVRPSVCIGGTMSVDFIITGITLDPANEFITELSDGTGDFSTPLVLGKVTSSTPPGGMQVSVPLSVIPASGYRVRLRTTSPIRVSPANDSDITMYPQPQVVISATPSGTVCEDTPVTFEASLIGNGPPDLLYGWYVNGVGPREGSTLVKTWTHSDGDIITCQLMYTGCSTIPSETVEMDVLPRPQVIITANTGPTICAPGSVTLTASFSGATAISYDWFHYEKHVGTNSPTYQVNLSDENDNDMGWYKCVVTNDGPACYNGSATSNTISVAMENPTILSVSLIPPQKICNGLPVTFSQTNTSAWDFQWTKNDQNMNTNSEYTDVFAVGDVIKVKAFGGPCANVPEIQSDPYSVTQVTDAFVPNVKIHQYPEGYVSPGTKVVFTTETTGGGKGPGFRWYKNDVDVTPPSRYNDPELGGIFALTPQNGDNIKTIMTSTDYCALPNTAESNTLQISVSDEAPHTTPNWLGRAAGPYNIKPDAFSIGNKAYVVAGRASYGSGTNPTDEFWEYNVETDKWTKKAKFGTLEERDQAAGFAANGKGFIGLGVGWISLKKDFWRYDPAADAWSSVATFPGTGSLGAFSIGVDTKGFVGMLSDADNYSDFWEYDAVADSWKKLPDFPGQPRTDLSGFAVGKKIYVGMGANGDTFFRDFWEYDTESQIWTAKASFPGEVHLNATTFALSGIGFYGLGYTIDRKAAPAMWRYNPETDAWTLVEGYMPFNYGASLYNAVGFSVGNRAFVYSSLRYTSGVTFEFNSFVIENFEGSTVGEHAKLDYQMDGPLASDNVFTVQLSSDTLFTNHLAIGSLHSAESKGVIDALLPGTATGDQYVRIVSSNPSMSTAPLKRTFLPVGIETGIDAVVQTYPNPVVDKLIVKLPVDFASKDCEFKVLNELGQQVLVGRLSPSDNVVDFSKQAPGLYLLRINIDRNNITRKIIFTPGR